MNKSIDPNRTSNANPVQAVVLVCIYVGLYVAMYFILP